MKRTIRQGVFETNSSSVHSLTMCSDDEWQKWENSELVYTIWDEKLVTKEESEKNRYKGRIDTPNDYFNHYQYEYDIFHEKYITPNGEVVHAFGYYGHD